MIHKKYHFVNRNLFILTIFRLILRNRPLGNYRCNQQQTKTYFLRAPLPAQLAVLYRDVERFSFYGIRPLLILFMAATVYEGGMDIPREQASAIVGIFLPVRFT